MTLLKNANLLIRFFLEICILISVGYWGFQFKSSLLLKICLGIGVPFIILIIWGAFVAPRSPYLLPTPYRIILELIIFGFATYALFSSGHPVLGKIFIGTVIINIILLLTWNQ
ncbi:YrdB family protein [Peribacillus tepidiphilus]|uniref:YrdB family protein n=1 Tax=Peribacillus tepidiphilus TaxID=2652445 RepID=UPI0035B50478